MKSLLKYTFLIFGIALFISACDGQYSSLVGDRLDENQTPGPATGESGDADFSNYVAIGNSLTAGFMDAALYDLGQQNSLAALIAGQLEFAGAPETFNQPDVNSASGFNTSVAQPPSGPVLGRFKLDTSIPGPSPVVTGELLQNTPFTGDASSLNNFGVPGATVGQLLSPATGGSGGNPFYARFASNPGTSTVLGDAIATQPSFFTLWIGNNDVLGYAISGASNPAILTSQTDFDNRYNAVVSQLMNNTSADGVAITIPPITAIPFFQAVTWDNITLDATTSQQLNGALQGVNDALQAVADNFPQHSQADIDARKINYAAGANPILVRDPELDDFEDEFDALGLPAAQRQALIPYEQSRPLTQGELVTLSAGAVLGTEANPGSSTPTTIGVVIPLGFNIQNPGNSTGDEFYLTLAEQQEINTSIAQFNGTIATAVANNSQRLALYDVAAGFPISPSQDPPGLFTDLLGLDGELGTRVDGTLLQPDFSPNGVFSTDGIHPNPRGNALLTNEILKVIEGAFGASIPKIEVLNLPSVQVCAGDCASQQGGS